MSIYVDETDPGEDPEPDFQPRQIVVQKGKDVKADYTLNEELGRGKFGTVHRCTEKATGKVFAAKFITTPKPQDRQDVDREVEIMMILQHPRLLQLYDAFDDGKKTMCLILEIIEGGELFERVIDEDFVLTEKAVTIFMRQICEGVQYMHSKNILHLDMKPENVLCISRTGNKIKLIDFGLARKYDPKKKLKVLFGTPEFVAPEVVCFETISYQTDMWSVGVICYVLLSGLSPFMGDSDMETMANVTRGEWDFEDESFDEISDDAKDFISKLLVKDRVKRLDANQALQHPWLRRQKEARSNYRQKEVEEIRHQKKVAESCKCTYCSHPNGRYYINKVIQEEDNLTSMKPRVCEPYLPIPFLDPQSSQKRCWSLLWAHLLEMDDSRHLVKADLPGMSQIHA